MKDAGEGNPGGPDIENPTPPTGGGCSPNGVLTGPQVPNDGMGMIPCGGGIPTLPNLPNPETTDLCEETKNLLAKPEVQTNVNTLKEQSKIKGDNSRENGFNVNLDGTTSDIIPGGKHSVDLGDATGKQGGYHNHTLVSGIKMHSAPDILSLLSYAIGQPGGDFGNAFFGMFGSEECSTCPDGYKYHHYIIRFNGTAQELTQYLYNTTWDKKALSNDYKEKYGDLTDLTSNYGINYIDNNGKITSEGLEKLFFDTLKSMGMEGKVNLQKIDNNGTVSNVTINNEGTHTTAVPCP